MLFADVAAYCSHLQAIIDKFSSQTTSLIITDDVAEWGCNNTIRIDGNPVATSVPAIGNNPQRIIIRRLLTEDQAAGVLSRLDFSGLGSKRSFLSSPIHFLTHLALHELAHLENSWPQSHEEECDHWALARMI